SVVALKDQFASMRSAGVVLRNTNSVHAQEMLGGLHVTFSKFFAFATEIDPRNGPAKDSCFQVLAFCSKIEHSLQQGRVGDIRVAGCVLPVARPFWQGVVISAANLVN